MSFKDLLYPYCIYSDSLLSIFGLLSTITFPILSILGKQTFKCLIFSHRSFYLYWFAQVPGPTVPSPYIYTISSTLGLLF